MGRGRLEVLVDNAWRTHVGRRGGEGCYDTYRSVLYRDPRASPWPLRVTGVSYARARQRPGATSHTEVVQLFTVIGGATHSLQDTAVQPRSRVSTDFFIKI